MCGEESKAEKAKKKRPTPYNRSAAKATSSSGNNASGKSTVRPGVCYNCFKPGHWQFECPEKKRKSSTDLLICYKFNSICSDIQDESIQGKIAHLINDKS